MRIGTALCILLGMSIGVSAQQTSVAPPVRILTFEEAIKIALKNSVLLNTQKNNLEYNQALRLGSIASAGPGVSVNGSASQFNGNSFNSNTGQVVNGVRDNISGSINGGINLFTGFAQINNIRQTYNLLEAQSYFVNRTAQDVMNTVSNQYLTVMRDVELLKIAKENFEALQKQLGQVKEMVILGAKSQVDEYNQDALTKGAELRFVQAEITLANDKALLTQTLLIDPFEQFDVEKPNWDVNAIGNETLNIEALAEQAKQFRADYQRAVRSEAAAKAGMQASKGAFFPQISAFGTIASGYNYQHDVPRTIFSQDLQMVIDNPNFPRPFNEQFKTNNVTKSYGVQLRMTIFNGLQNRTTYVLQKTNYDNSVLARENIEYQIRNDVQRTVRVYEGSKKAYTISVDQLAAAEQAFNFETERYNLGVTNFVEFTNANRVLVQSQTDKAQAEYQLVFQRFFLEYAVGTLKAEEFQK